MECLAGNDEVSAEGKDYPGSRKREPGSSYEGFQKKKTTLEGKVTLGVVFGRK